MAEEPKKSNIHEIMSRFLNPEELTLIKEVRLRRNHILTVQVQDGRIDEIAVKEVTFKGDKSGGC